MDYIPASIRAQAAASGTVGDGLAEMERMKAAMDAMSDAEVGGGMVQRSKGYGRNVHFHDAHLPRSRL